MLGVVQWKPFGSDLNLYQTMDVDLFLHHILDPDSNPVGSSVAFMGKSHGANVYDQFFN
jgi:hypothetical protein